MRVATAELFESQEPLLDTLSKKRRRRRRAPAAVDLAGGLDALPARSSGEASSRRGRAQMQRRDDAPLTTMGRRARRLRFAGAAPLHGWVPDVAQFCYGLPGALAPMGDFDPLKLSKQTISTVRRYREAEVMHGRVAMVAFVGFLVGEHGAHQVLGRGALPDARRSAPEDARPPARCTRNGRGVCEGRAARGWVTPESPEQVWEMRDSYYPGDIGFDPLRLAPADASGFATMATTELQHGRLAMIAFMGLVAQGGRRTSCSSELASRRWRRREGELGADVRPTVPCPPRTVLQSPKGGTRSELSVEGPLAGALHGRRQSVGAAASEKVVAPDAIRRNDALPVVVQRFGAEENRVLGR